jgi:exodeoxyribonuclease-5
VTTSTITRASDWSDQQLDALDAVEAWLDDGGEDYFYLAGYAGTGKTTLAAEIAERQGGDVVFGALTGKAAAVMAQRGCAGAATIDSLIYRAAIEVSCAQRPPCANPPCKERCRHARERYAGRELNKDSVVKGADLCIVDEVSMVGSEMGHDLLSFRTPLLVLGDKAQLPPIGDGGFFTNGKPDFQLTQVHRQALGSPVIELATRARKELPLKYGGYGDSAVVDEVRVKEMLNFDQVIVGTHRTRHSLNKKIRKALGYGGTTPERGEKVIALRNNRKLGLRNGTLWTVMEAGKSDDGFVDMVVASESGDGLPVTVIAPEAGFTSYDGHGGDLPGHPFAFGYAITCHKAQGSQWDSVLVIDESGVFREHRWHWLYTAITRAVRRVVVL